MTSPITAAQNAKENVPAGLANRAGSLRVGLICDFTEENWPSMDLVGDMLFENLGEDSNLSVTQLRPRMHRHFGSIPFAGTHRALFDADRLVNRFAIYPVWLRKWAGQFEVFHVIDHSYAQLVHSLPAGRTVVTCHDLDAFRCLLSPQRDPRPRWFRAMTRRILNGFQKASHVIAVSAVTRDELLHHGLFRSHQVSVVPNGVHPSCSALPDAESDAEASRLLSSDCSSSVWLLNVGSTIPRKRLDVLLRVFAAVREDISDAQLIRVGGDMTPSQRRLAQELGIENAVHVLPKLTRNVLAAVYRHSDLLMHTADAEGFGLPLIEAMACGCPVVASDLPVLREVGGMAAAYCPVADVSVWKETVVRLLREKLEKRGAWELRRQQAIEYAAQFSWAENAQQTARIYQQVLSGKQPD